MSITLNINNPDGFAIKSTKIYRSTTPIDPLNPGTPLVTLPEGTLSYVDDTIPNQSSRYYLPVIQGADGKDMYMSVSNHGNFPTVGPGRTRPLRGNWKLGYLDVLTGDAFITAQQLWDSFGMTSADGTPVATALTWHKLCLNDRIIFWPSTPIIRVSMTTTVRDKLLVPTDITYGGLTYTVHVPRIDTTSDFISALTTINPESDFGKLVLAMYSTQAGTTGTEDLTNVARLADFSYTELIPYTSSIMYREKNSAGNQARGSTTVNTLGYASGTQTFMWQPFLELKAA